MSQALFLQLSLHKQKLTEAYVASGSRFLCSFHLLYACFCSVLLSLSNRFVQIIPRIAPHKGSKSFGAEVIGMQRLSAASVSSGFVSCLVFFLFVQINLTQTLTLGLHLEGPFINVLKVTVPQQVVVASQTTAVAARDTDSI